MASQLFAADVMLGRLATWLRLLGYDTTYGPHLAGCGLVRHARNEKRAILTRDHRVLRVARGLLVTFITSNEFRLQLCQVIDTHQLDPFARLFTRCTACNIPVETVPKPQVKARVPAYVFATQQCFVRCPSCHRICWPGTHLDRAHEQLRLMGYRPATTS